MDVRLGIEGAERRTHRGLRSGIVIRLEDQHLPDPVGGSAPSRAKTRDRRWRSDRSAVDHSPRPKPGGFLGCSQRTRQAHPEVKRCDRLTRAVRAWVSSSLHKRKFPQALRYYRPSTTRRARAPFIPRPEGRGLLAEKDKYMVMPRNVAQARGRIFVGHRVFDRPAAHWCELEQTETRHRQVKFPMKLLDTAAWGHRVGNGFRRWCIPSMPIAWYRG